MAIELLEQLKVIKIYNYIEYCKKYNKNYDKLIEYKINYIITKEKINVSDLTRKYKNELAKWSRLRKRIKRMIYQAKQHNNKLWFATFTINDENMNKDHQRKLKESYKDTNYIFNVDYGTTTNRKHYHGIIEQKEKPSSWNYGFCDFREIKIENINNLAMYINKITNHTLKESTKKERIIYSRIKGD